MELSRLKIEIYDFLGLILPGLVLVAEIWLTFEGWVFTEGSRVRPKTPTAVKLQ